MLEIVCDSEFVIFGLKFEKEEEEEDEPEKEEEESPFLDPEGKEKWV